MAKDKNIATYLGNIDTDKVTSGLWDPTKQWNRWHGDGKSSTGGTYHIETMKDSNNVYKAKVLKGKSTAAVVSAEWAADTNPAPTVSDVIGALKAGNA